ncbi:MAG: hypothetical protein K8F54_13160, partial [Altibacter sp.]|uniref:hypothetical protein n=1 Tax=Altibacter sp. TaxID=2024823 RepID=UPI001D65779D
MNITEKNIFHIEGNIDYAEINRLINFYNDCAIENGGAVDIIEGTIYNLIKIIITPRIYNDEPILEVDPLFLSYLVLFIEKFYKTKIDISIINPYLEELEENFSEANFQNCVKVSNRAFSLRDQIISILEYPQFKNRISLTAFYYNKEKQSKFPVPKNAGVSERFIPLVLIDSKDKISFFFDKKKTYLTNSQAFRYFEKIEQKVKGFYDNIPTLSIFETFLLRVLLTDDIPNNKKSKIDKKSIDYYIAFVEQLSSSIKELALNIVEHSRNTETSQSGVGVITARIFEKRRLTILKESSEKKYLEPFDENDFFLDINVIDLGYKPIRKKYIENIELNKQNDPNNNLKINYEHDIDLVKNKNVYRFEDFFLPNAKTDHQLNKLISRYGLQYFTHVATERFGGYVKAVSHNEAFFMDKNNGVSLDKSTNRYGTSYNCLIPLEKFNSHLQQLKLKKKLGLQTGHNENSLKSIDKYYKIPFSELNGEVDLNKIIYYDNVPTKIVGKYAFIFEVYSTFFKIADHHKNNIHLINAKLLKIDNASDWVRLLSAISLEIKNIIIYNISKVITRDIIELRRTQSKHIDFDFWEDESFVLFYSYQKGIQDNDFNRFGATLLTGKTEAKYNYINLRIWKHHYSYYKQFIQRNTKGKVETEYYSPTSLLLTNGNLKYFDLLIKNKDIYGSPISLFEQSVQYALNKNLPENLLVETNNKGYKISNTHFRLGSKIHIDSFYYAKRLFQNSFFTTPLSYLLTNYISEIILRNNS